MPYGTDLKYNSVTQTTTAVDLKGFVETTLGTGADAGKIIIEQWLDLDATAVAAIDTITLETTLPTANAYFQVTVQGATKTKLYSYRYETTSTDTADTIAQELAMMINTHPDVLATCATNTVVVTALVAGATLTTTVACKNVADDSDVSSKISVAVTTPASGTAKTRKVAELKTQLVATADERGQYNVEIAFFNGAAAPVQAGGTLGPYPATSPWTLQALQAVT